MVPTATTPIAASSTSGRIGRSGAIAMATTGGAEMTISRAATIALWKA